MWRHIEEREVGKAYACVCKREREREREKERKRERERVREKEMIVRGAAYILVFWVERD